MCPKPVFPTVTATITCLGKIQNAPFESIEKKWALHHNIDSEKHCVWVVPTRRQELPNVGEQKSSHLPSNISTREIAWHCAVFVNFAYDYMKFNSCQRQGQKVAIFGRRSIPVIPASDEYGSTTLQSTTASGPQSRSQLCPSKLRSGLIDITPTFGTHRQIWNEMILPSWLR